MKVVHGIEQYAAQFASGKVSGGMPPSVVLIGNFDGVHLGHQALLARGRQLRQSLFQSPQQQSPKGGAEGRLIVLTFDPHPLKILHPERVKGVIFPREDQVQQLELRNVDVLILQRFDLDFSQIQAEEFLKSLLCEKLNMRHLVIGHDFKFGKNRQGDMAYLRQQSTQLGFEVSQVEAVLFEGKAVSSSRIRQCLVDGEILQANAMLGRPFSLVGEVVRGDGRGRQIGFPTANVLPQGDLFLHTGVYATSAIVKGKKYDSITNVGKAPTFRNQNDLRVEVHILNFDADIYGEQVKVEFLNFIRSEKKFSGVSELVAQIKADIAEVVENPERSQQ